MSVWTDARDNIRQGLVSAWLGLNPEARAFAIGLALGILCGAVTVALWAL